MTFSVSYEDKGSHVGNASYEHEDKGSNIGIYLAHKYDLSYGNVYSLFPYIFLVNFYINTVSLLHFLSPFSWESKYLLCFSYFICTRGVVVVVSVVVTLLVVILVIVLIVVTLVTLVILVIVVTSAVVVIVATLAEVVLELEVTLEVAAEYQTAKLRKGSTRKTKNADFKKNLLFLA